MTASSADPHRQVAAAYAWASGLIRLATRLVTDGVDVDLAPIRPAIRELCEVVATLPKADAADWLVRLVALQHQLAALGQELAARHASGTPSEPQ
jgi:hypothetical protein